MSQPFLGEVKILSFGMVPRGWALCNGQLLPINQNQALFSVLGTAFGGDGVNTFALPNLQGAAPLHTGPGYQVGQKGGSAMVTLAGNQIGHGHMVNAAVTATTNTAAGNFPASAPSNLYGSPADTTMNSGTIGPTGGSAGHNNMQPYLVMNFVIALVGIFPSRN
jgi:microcystin-dependent protein